MTTRRIRRARQQLFACIFAVFAAPVLARGQDAVAVTHGACAVRLGDKTLFIKDPWSRRYALPGGAVARDETAAQAAARHTLDATGLVVDAQRRLGLLGDTAVFDCRLFAAAPLLAEDVVRVPAKAHYTTIEARFLSAQKLSVHQWRYRHQAQTMPALCSAATANEPVWVRGVTTDISPLFTSELDITRSVQRYVPQALKGFVRALSVLGTELTFFAVSISVCCFCSFALGCELSLYLLSVSLFNCLVKQLFALPRPFYLDPSLQLQHASSFGFPSGHTVVVSSLALWIGARVLPSWRRTRLTLLLCVLGCGLSRIYLGVHFVHDVLGACLESSLVWFAYVSILRLSARSQMPLSLWTVLTVGLSSMTLWTRPEPEPITLICASAGYLFGAMICRNSAERLSWRRGSILAVAMALGFTCLEKLLIFLQPDEASFDFCLMLTIFGGVCHGVLIPLFYRLNDSVAKLQAKRLWPV